VKKSATKVNALGPSIRSVGFFFWVGWGCVFFGNKGKPQDGDRATGNQLGGGHRFFQKEGLGGRRNCSLPLGWGGFSGRWSHWGKNGIASSVI